MEQESKIVFKDGEKIRCIRAIIENTDDYFVYLRRSNGSLMLNKTCILKIEKWDGKNIVGMLGDKNGCRK